jgi:hypothetical protein
MAYKIHQGKSIIRRSHKEILFYFSLHIAVTQLHTQPGVVEKLLEDTRDCVSEILKSDNKNDTPTVRILSPMIFHSHFDSTRLLFTVQIKKYRISPWSVIWRNYLLVHVMIHI